MLNLKHKFYFFPVLGFELRAYTLGHSTSPFCEVFFLFFVVLGLELRAYT
jgi:hypothetical protein